MKVLLQPVGDLPHASTVWQATDVPTHLVDKCGPWPSEGFWRGWRPSRA
jgi:hypothetical protein